MPACIIVGATTECNINQLKDKKHCQSHKLTHVKFLIFGGKRVSFVCSFHEITVNIKQDLASGDIISFSIKQEVQLRQNSDNWIKNLDKWPLGDSGYHSFKYQVMNSRYLLLFGGFSYDCYDDNIVGETFCIDLHEKKFLLKNEFEYILPYHMLPRVHHFINNTLYLFDGYIDWHRFPFSQEIREEYKGARLLFILKVSFAELEWNIIRLIWIAFLKNVSNEKCLLAQLPQDIIKSIEKMLKPLKTVWIHNHSLGFLKPTSKGAISKKSKQSK